MSEQTPIRYQAGHVGKTQTRLLLQTQAYLHAQLERTVPDAELTEAWHRFYRVYSSLIRRFVLAHDIRDADVDDCVQEVWRTVAKKLTEFKRPTNRPGLRAWLYSIARSRAVDLLRRKSRTTAKSLSAVVEQGLEPEGSTPGPGQRYEQDCENAMLQTAVAELRERISNINYRVLRMRMFEGRKVAEVASTLGLTPEQVRYRQYRTIQKLKAELSAYRE